MNKLDDKLYKEVVEVHEWLLTLNVELEKQLHRLHKIEEIIKTGEDPSKRKSKVSDYNPLRSYHQWDSGK